MGFAKSNLTFLSVLFALCLAGWPGSLVADQPLLLTGGKVHLPGHDEPQAVSILIVEGKIASIGNALEVPEGTKEIALNGCQVTPGLIESRGKLWMTAAALSDNSSKAELNVVDAIDPWSQDWRELAAQGITSVYVQPASNSTLGGYGAVLKVGPFASPDAIVLKDKSGLQASIGVTGNTSKDRYAQVEGLKKQLEAAKKELEKQQKKAAEEAKKKAEEAKAGKKSGKSESDTGKDGKGKPRPKPAGDKPETSSQDEDQAQDDKEDSKSEEQDEDESNPAQAALIRVLKKELPLHIEVHHADALKRVLELADEFKFNLVLDGLAQVDSAMESLSQEPRAMVVGPMFETTAVPGYRKNADRTGLPAILNRPGIPFAISGFPSRAIGSRLLRTQAAAAVSEGVLPGQAMAAITSNPARMLGVGDLAGTIESNKRADLAVFAGDPLDPATPVRLTICEGVVTYQSDAALRETMVQVPVETRGQVERLTGAMPKRYQIRSSHVLNAAGKFEPGVINVVDGKLSGNSSDGDQGPVFDLGDCYITPGLVNAHTTLGQANTITDSTESDSSYLRAADAVDLTTQAAEEMLHGGFIHAGISPGNTNTSAGLLGHARLGSAGAILNAQSAGQLVLTDAARNRNRYPASLAGQVEFLSQLFNQQTQPTDLYVSQPIAESLNEAKISTFSKLKNGNRPAILLADSDPELAAALGIAKQEKLTGALASSGRLDNHLESIAELGLAVIVPQLGGAELQPQLDQYVALDQHGVGLMFSGESAEKIRATAALLASAGVNPESIMQGLTLLPYQKLGFAGEAGLKTGSAAELVVWDGHPLSLSAKPLSIIVDGQPVTDE